MSSVVCVLQQVDSTAKTVDAAIHDAVSLHAGLIILYTYRLTGLDKRNAVMQMRKEHEQRIRQKFSVLEKEISAQYSVPVEFRIEIGFLSDRLELIIQTDPNVKTFVLDAVTANMVTDHWGQTLKQYLESLKVPVHIVEEYAEP